MAWSELAGILRRNGVSPDSPPWNALAESETIGAESRQRTIGAIVASLTDQSNATEVVRALCAEPSPEARRLALELAAHVPTLEPNLVSWLRPLLRDRRLPRSERLDAAAALLRTTGPRGGAAARVLRDFAAGFGRLRVLTRRKELRRRFGAAGAFDRLCLRLQRHIPLRCPRCGVRRRPASMIRHLWRRHGKLLARRRVRSPMSWLDDWAARAPKSAQPDDGVAHLSRQMLRRHLESPDAEPALRVIAARHRAALCPHCYALVPLPADEYPDPGSMRELELSAGRLSGEGFVIAHAAPGIDASVRVTLPDGTLIERADPQGRWNRAAAIRRLVAPWVVLAITMACLLPPELAILGTALALSAAYVFRLVVRGRSAPVSTGALVDTAWSRVVPPLVDRPPTTQSCRYLARLGLTSVRRGSARARTGPLGLAERSVRRALNAGVATADQWTPLVGLRISDLERLGDDPVPALVDTLAKVVLGDDPLAHLELLLAHVPWREWTFGRRARLRVALLGRFFDSGLGIWELVEVGEVVPAFRELLHTANLDGLARLRLLWSMTIDRPWARCGSAATAFDLAAYVVTESELGAAPDVLLYQARIEGAHRELEPLWITGGGLVFRGARLPAPEPIEVHLRLAGRGYALHFGAARFRFTDDPTHLAHSLSEWSDFLFREFLPRTDAAIGTPDGAKLERILRSKTLVCPECGGLFRGRLPG